MNEGERDREREQASEEARGRVLFYFVPCSHFSARFLTGPRCSLSKPPPPTLPFHRGCLLWPGGAGAQSLGIRQD